MIALTVFVSSSRSAKNLLHLSRSLASFLNQSFQFLHVAGLEDASALLGDFQQGRCCSPPRRVPRFVALLHWCFLCHSKPPDGFVSPTALNYASMLTASMSALM